MIKNGFVDALKTAVLTMNDDEVMACLRIVSDERAVRRERQQGSMKDTLSEGDEVFFESTKHGRVEGIVKKVKYKKAIISTKSGNWDVPFHMLQYK